MITKNSKKKGQVQMVSLDQLVPEDHLLRKIDRYVDFSFIYDLVEDKYSPDFGRPSIDPVTLIKIPLIQCMFGIKSMRQTIKEIEVNVAYRWFLGLDFFDDVPHFSTFGKNYKRRFEDTDLFEQIFTNILLQCMKRGLVDTNTMYVDATHVKAAANSKKSKKILVAKRTARFMDEQLKEEIDKDREEHGKKSLKDKDDVLRNKVRLHVLPLLEEIAPGATANIDKTANYLREAEKVYNAEVQRDRISLKADSCEVSIDELLQQPSPSVFLHEWLRPLGFNSSQTEQILGAVNSESGREFTSATHTLVVNRSKLIVEPNGKPMKSIKIPECGTYRYDETTTYKVEITSDISISKSADIATVDADKVKLPLTIRPVENGDWFIPFGMTGRKLVSDFLTDKKFSILQKRRQLALVDASGAIVWLIGCRTDNRFKVSAGTTKILRITYKLD